MNVVKYPFFEGIDNNYCVNNTGFLKYLLKTVFYF